MTRRERPAHLRHGVIARSGLPRFAATIVVLLVFGGCAQTTDEPQASAAATAADAAPATPAATRNPLPEGNTAMAARYPIDPCELLSAEDVGDTLGEPVGDGKRNERTCTWTSTKDGDVTVSLTAHGEGQKPRNVCSDLFDTGEPVDGLKHPMANEAAYSEAEGLAVFTGKKLPAHSCLIFVSSPRAKLDRDALMELAEIALDNHPFEEKE